LTRCKNIETELVCNRFIAGTVHLFYYFYGSNRSLVLMIVFINDRPIKLVGPKAASQLTALATPNTSGHRVDYDQLIDARLEALRPDTLHGHLLILNATPATISKLLSLLQKADARQLLSITLGCIDKDACEEAIKKPFKIIKAGGGVVMKGNKLLLMFRRGVWDLPKGKLDDGESSKEGALREVEEETGVRVAIDERICTTWHTYTLNGNRILKRTKWYLMRVLDDSRMAPQEEEDIEKLAWLDWRETQLALANSFSSIRFVIEAANQTVH
jgi:8-oxo-dGTP pyrophosphatase MutT (NUDIX family)